MPGGVIVGESGLCCCVPCLMNAIKSLCLLLYLWVVDDLVLVFFRDMAFVHGLWALSTKNQSIRVSLSLSASLSLSVSLCVSLCLSVCFCFSVSVCTSVSLFYVSCCLLAFRRTTISFHCVARWPRGPGDGHWPQNLGPPQNSTTWTT